MPAINGPIQNKSALDVAFNIRRFLLRGILQVTQQHFAVSATPSLSVAGRRVSRIGSRYALRCTDMRAPLDLGHQADEVDFIACADSALLQEGASASGYEDLSLSVPA